jgi:hypothetical protein
MINLALTRAISARRVTRLLHLISQVREGTHKSRHVPVESASRFGA